MARVDQDEDRVEVEEVVWGKEVRMWVAFLPQGDFL